MKCWKTAHLNLIWFTFTLHIWKWTKLSWQQIITTAALLGRMNHCRAESLLVSGSLLLAGFAFQLYAKAPSFTYRWTGVHLFGLHQSLDQPSHLSKWSGPFGKTNSGPFKVDQTASIANTRLNLIKSPSDFNTVYLSSADRKLSVWEKQRRTVRLYS